MNSNLTRSKRLVKSLIKDNTYYSSLRLKFTCSNSKGDITYWKDIYGFLKVFKLTDYKIIDITGEDL